MTRDLHEMIVTMVLMLITASAQASGGWKMTGFCLIGVVVGYGVHYLEHRNDKD